MVANQPAEPEKQKMWTIDTTVHQKPEPSEAREAGAEVKKKVTFAEDHGTGKLGTKENPLEFDIVDTKDEGSDSDDGPFSFKDISADLAYYQQQQMSSFQKLNTVFLTIASPALQRYLAGGSKTPIEEPTSEHHIWFCDQIDLPAEANEREEEELKRILGFLSVR